MTDNTTRPMALDLAEDILRLLTDIRCALHDEATWNDELFHGGVLVLNAEDLAELKAYKSPGFPDPWVSDEPPTLWSHRITVGELDRGHFIVGYERELRSQVNG